MLSLSVSCASWTPGRNPCLRPLLGQVASGTHRPACGDLLTPKECWGHPGARRHDAHPHGAGRGWPLPPFFTFRRHAPCVVMFQNNTLQSWFFLIIKTKRPLLKKDKQQLESITVWRAEARVSCQAVTRGQSLLPF